MKNSNPTVAFRPFRDFNIEVRLYGRNEGSTDWNIACLTDETAKKPTPESRECLDRINLITSAAGVSRLYAPRPTEFNAKICYYSSLATEFITLKTTGKPDQASTGGCVVHRGFNADGCNIPHQSGFWMSTADCPTIIAYAPTGALICAHAGRDCLFDRKYLLGESSEPRQYNSVVDAICTRMVTMGATIDQVRFFITCGISGRHFDHPWDHSTHGSTNRKIIEHLLGKWGSSFLLGEQEIGEICLDRLIAAQLIAKGVSSENIICDGIDTFSDKLSNDHTWWSTRRGDAKQRNGVLVIHR